MGMSCKELWREVSNYIEGTITAEVRKEVEAHLAHCNHCTALVDGVHNVIVLVADGRTFSLPTGFDERLKARLQKELLENR